MQENSRSDAPMDDLLDYMKKALEKMTIHINTMERQVKSERRRWKKPNLYKTELCDHWRNKRKCMFGLKCWYAHGPHELRPSSTCSSIMSCTTTGMSGEDLSSGVSLYGVAIEGASTRPAITADGETTLQAADVTINNQEAVPQSSGVTTSVAPSTAPINYSSAMCIAGAGQYPQQPAIPAPHQQPHEMRPAFFVSFDNHLPFAPAQPAMLPSHPPAAQTAAVEQPKVSGQVLPADPNFQPNLGFDLFRSSNLHFNFGSSAGMNFGLSGFGFPNPAAPAFTSSDNWMGALASSFIIPSKNVWLH